jgi:predicted branched-subunit amino acid permease
MLSSDPIFTADGIRRGIWRSQVLVPGVFVYGMAFGLIADQGGLSLLQALLISAVVYSGSAQLAAMTILAAGTSPLILTAWTLVATILVINARYVLFSATLRPWMGGLHPLKAYSTLYVLGDGNWMLSLKAHGEGERDAGFVFGSGLAMFLPWLAGTLIGHAAGNLVPDPKRLALDFLMASFAAAMMVGMTKKSADLGIIAASAGVAALAYWLGLPNWAPVLAGFAGGVIAFAFIAPSESAR